MRPPAAIETRPDGDLRTKIWLTLKELEPPSAFMYSDRSSAVPNPFIDLPPYGFLGLPLSSDDAKKIISQASQSPFGKGAETLVDTSVRKSWELNPNQFSLKNPDWNETLEKIVDTVVVGLGIKKGTADVSAELYKLLLYEEGAFFKAHKDSEKTPGMFATLIICLPSLHEGGKLVLTHDDKTCEFETEGPPFSTSYAAWYADITHEVLPVTSGYRLVLTYNLIRQADFEIPLYDSSHFREQEQQLSTLLEQYRSLLEQGNETLPPILVHKLKHKYTQANLKLESLKPQDLAQVSALKRISAELGFDIYLSVLELEINTDEEYDDDAERTQNLKHVVELDGTLVVDSFVFPEGTLIDPAPQDAGKADKIDRQGYTGNQGMPITYWYRNTVVVLVPPMKRPDFVFEFGSSGTVIEPLFCKLIEEFSKDPTQKQRLEKLCEVALKQKPRHYSCYSESIPLYFERAATTAIELGRFDLFDKGSKTTEHKIILKNANLLGRWIASHGLATMSDRLMEGVKVAPTVAEKVEFLKSVAEGFKAVMQEPDSAENAGLKQWSDQTIFASIAELSKLSKDDAVSLAQLYTDVNWSLYELKVTPVVLKAATMIKISFINELMSTLQEEFVKEQRSFIEMIILDIWKQFVFDSTYQEYSLQNKDDLNQKDIFLIVKNSVKILSSECVETTIIPKMLTAIPGTSAKCATKLFVPIVQFILKNELVGFELSTDNLVPPPSHKCLVQALLTKYLKEFVGLEPRAPKNWSLPARSCNCKDCTVVNNFLRDPVKRSLDYPCGKNRRMHLHRTFTGSSYDIETIRNRNPNVWRITKHQRSYETVKSAWIKNTETAKQTLSELKNDEPVAGKLEAYLKPYFSVIMNADVKELPDLKSLTTTPEASENTTPNLPPNQPCLKREASEVDFPAKRTR